MQDSIADLYEEVRFLLLESENILSLIDQLKQKILRDKLTELLKTCQADLMIFLDLIYQLENCGSDADINEIISSFSESCDKVH